MSEIFEGLAVIGDTVSEEDRVVHLLANLPESYNVLVTALKAQSKNIPKWELVTERLLLQESKLKEKSTTTMEDNHKALTAGQKGIRKQFTCQYCHKPGHFKKDRRKYLAAQKKQFHVTDKRETPGSESEALLTIHALAATSSGTWIIDSGATCNTCNNKSLFIDTWIIHSK